MLVEVWASSDCTKPGDNIKIRATVTNKGTRTQVIDLGDRPVLDIVIDHQGQTVRWSDGKPLTTDLTRLELKPGESKTIKMDWVVRQPASGWVFGVSAPFIYSTKFADYPLQPGVLISVSICPGPFGP